jgi:hypothetical protein
MIEFGKMYRLTISFSGLAKAAVLCAIPLRYIVAQTTATLASR